MNSFPPSKYHLRRRDFQRMHKIKPGATLQCDAGLLWVTQTGDRQDYILLPGDQMTVNKRGKVLVEAMRDADFHILQLAQPDNTGAVKIYVTIIERGKILLLKNKLFMMD